MYMSNNSGGTCTGTSPLLLQGSTATCWFYASFHSFIGTRAGVKILYDALIRYINTELKSDVARRDFINPNVTCPMYGKLHSKFNFWKLIFHAFYQPSNASLRATALGRNRRLLVQNIITERRSTSANWGFYPTEQILNRLGIVNYNRFSFNGNLVPLSNRPFVPNPDFVIVYPQIGTVPPSTT